MTPSQPLLQAIAASGAVFGVVLLLVILDVAAGIQLPAGIRPVLPWLLVGTALVSITLLVGALGTPTRPGADAEEPDSTPEESGS